MLKIIYSDAIVKRANRDFELISNI